MTRAFPGPGERMVFVTEVMAPGRTSWLVFTAPEADNGGPPILRRRRLHRFPADWSALPDTELWALYERATPAPTSPELAAHGAVIAETRQALVRVVARSDGEAVRDEDLAERLEFTEALLAAAYDRLDAVSAALATAEAELAATNEELRAMNAELQSAVDYRSARQPPDRRAPTEEK